MINSPVSPLAGMAGGMGLSWVCQSDHLDAGAQAQGCQGRWTSP